MKNILYVIVLLGSLVVHAEDAATSWTDKVSIYGDVRLRHEMIQKEGFDDRHRQRIRVRLGTKINFDDSLQGYIRIANQDGSNNITSTNQTMGDVSDRKDIGLDLAYVQYKVCDCNGVELLAGKMTNPFWFAGKSELVFDNDWTPEGAAIKTSWSNDTWGAKFNFGGFWLKERNDVETAVKSNADSILYTAQLVVSYNTDPVDVNLGIANHNFTNMKTYAVLNEAKGNSETGGKYIYEYNLMNYSLEVELKDLAGNPLVVFADFVQNPDPDNNNTATLYGVRYGKLKDPKSFQVELSSKEVEKDSVVGIVTESDAFDGGTNGKSIKVAAGYQLSKSVATQLTYFTSNKNIADGQTETDYKRAMLDFGFNF